MENKSSKERDLIDPRLKMVRYIIGLSCLMVVVFTLGGWIIIDEQFALSVLIGGALINISFLFLKSDVEKLLHHVSVAGERSGTVSRVGKVKFFIKFYARLIILGLLLIVLVSKFSINAIGLSLGLATVMLSAVVTVVSMKLFDTEESLRSV